VALHDRTARARSIDENARPLRAAAPLIAALLIVAASGRVPARSAGLPHAAERAITEISARELRTHVETLASDAFAGRGVGHAGNRRAEEYVAETLRRASVAPAAETHFQTVELYQPSLGSDARLTIGPAGQPPLVDLPAGASFHPLPLSADRTAAGPILFAGHGISEPRLRHDDYARLGARGAVVLALDGLPDSLDRRAGLDETERAAMSTLDRKMADAHAHGAIGLIVVRSYLGELHHTWPADTSTRAPSYVLRDRVRAAPLAVAAITKDAAAPVRRALEARTPLTAALAPGIIPRTLTVHNIVGLMKGRSTGRVETVVVGAHLDHDGVDDEGRIYNGADDNASGTAAVLAMASAFVRAAEAGARPARHVVFALWNAEEKGSLGAEQYIRAPAPAGRIVANINLDMIGRHEDVPNPTDPRFHGFRRTTPAESGNVLHVLGYTYSPEFARLADRANERVGLTLRKEYDREAQGLLRRSDNWPFLKRRIPALFFTTGLHPDYHTPEDDTERIDFAKLERITELVSRLAWMVADGDAPRFQVK
jgi:hypothetical protein